MLKALGKELKLKIDKNKNMTKIDETEVRLTKIINVLPPHLSIISRFCVFMENWSSAKNFLYQVQRKQTLAERKHLL